MNDREYGDAKAILDFLRTEILKHRKDAAQKMMEACVGEKGIEEIINWVGNYTTDLCENSQHFKEEVLSRLKTYQDKIK